MSPADVPGVFVATTFLLVGSMSAAQWLLLRRHVSWASTWLLVNCVLGLAWALVGLASGQLSATPNPDVLGQALEGGASGLVYGVLTAPVLIWLARRPAGDRVGACSCRPVSWAALASSASLLAIVLSFGVLVALASEPTGDSWAGDLPETELGERL